MNPILLFKKWPITIFVMGLIILVISCNKNFDEPPLNADPDIAVTMTIAELKARYSASGDFQTIEDDKVISGIVTADDRSGNFYKQIVIQDETGGIPIIIDVNSLYTMYPVGRRVYVKVKGLMLGDYGGTIQLGMDSTRSSNGQYLNLGRIPENLLSAYLIKGSFGNEIIPKLVKPSDFTGTIQDPLLSAFVQINNAEFKDADLVKTYANAASPTTESARNFTIKPCDDTKSIVLRNSSYASFAGYTVAQGNGPLVGVASVFNGTVQMTIRDTGDVQFKGVRCNGQTPVGTTKTIAEVLAYATGDSTIPAGVWIEGVVVSNTSNEASGNYRLQDGTSGIQIRFASGSNPTSGALGEKLKVYVGGYRFSIFSGGLQINGPDVSSNVGTGTVTARVATIADIIANMRAWESTVVKINTVTLTETSSNATGKTYTVKDATGELSTFIRNSSGIIAYDSANSVTAYVSVYQPTGGAAGPQITLRTQDDIIGGRNTVVTPPTGGPDLIFSEYLEGSSNNKYIEVYNAGSTAADLSKYSIALYANGGTTAGNTLTLSSVQATLDPGKTIVIQNSSATLTLPTGVTAYSSSVTFFNGDDALELIKDGAVIDVFGLKGEDPGTGWAVAGVTNATVNNTIRRKTTIIQGNTNWASSAGTNATDSEWIIAAIDDASNLGSR
ncbi:MAG: DUF5689 domain-containing protein [Niabella sp.]